MDELMDAMATDESPSQISDKIKEILFNKSAERIDAFKTDVANGVFGDVDLEDEDLEDEELNDETVDEVEDEVEAEGETEVEAELEDQQ
jgi:divalent metal cation (Fe/Co/Zn/Cd) transporter